MREKIDNGSDRTDDKPIVTIKDTGVRVLSEKLGLEVQMPDFAFAEAVIKPEKQSEAEQNPDEAEIEDIISRGGEVFLAGPNISMRVKAFRRQYLRAVKPLLEKDGTEAENDENVIEHDFAGKPDIKKALRKQEIDVCPTCTLYAQSPEEMLINAEERAGDNF
ncbi:hypothetical protein HZA39_01020 [Candidatus Peregrinibacteria bacterium]|nr:hypothetical protein [Candidatus Peregrinibacteria bacterium]